ncbi:type II TA system antitoxin MqsA family protein [Roseateles amylovorans]|uniref:Type II toxin-antitoxin system MqsA family antitoxin n=1 Tax=Roseateles amylovorans TaxID=2978473 RepID=A0ABY6AW17_9BURK|nr:type II TA system antitoxin MqsA family protein [Roseateles amylovorans]UXH77138.1 type II toxin-antitoxin system MqsA family antitoxin [Roseateles amylovorans]
MNKSTRHPCPVCRKGQLLPTTTHRDFHPRGTLVRVELLASVCDRCGKETIRSEQHDQNLRRLAARKSAPAYAGLLLGEEIAALRIRYGLTQQAASTLFGKGKIAFSRYENEVTYPDQSTTLLLRMAIDKPDSLQWLADQAGVPLPLWKERSEDRRRAIRKAPVSGASAPPPSSKGIKSSPSERHVRPRS